ncbi:MAG: FtsX-like permease family protein, partial [Gemmatimonadetes bacterium]|nr:FtsX-like permease family protein [Gemmatimonadota bacterium]
LVPQLRAAVQAVDPSIPFAHVQSMENIMSASTARFRFTSVLLAVAAGVALVLAAVGLYGVVSYIVGRRTREIGIRIAVGAEPADVRREVLRRSLLLVVAGLVIGLGVALGSSRLMRGLLYGVEPTHPLAFVMAVVALGLVAMLASWLPARRAARVDPVEALRAE